MKIRICRPRPRARRISSSALLLSGRSRCPRRPRATTTALIRVSSPARRRLPSPRRSRRTTRFRRRRTARTRVARGPRLTVRERVDRDDRVGLVVERHQPDAVARRELTEERLQPSWLVDLVLVVHRPGTSTTSITFAGFRSSRQAALIRASTRGCGSERSVVAASGRRRCSRHRREWRRRWVARSVAEPRDELRRELLLQPLAERPRRASGRQSPRARPARCTGCPRRTCPRRGRSRRASHRPGLRLVELEQRRLLHRDRGGVSRDVRVRAVPRRSCPCRRSGRSTARSRGTRSRIAGRSRLRSSVPRACRSLRSTARRRTTARRSRSRGWCARA